MNPIGQNVLGVSYPFELIKNKTLDFFSKTLPILKADDTLPKVAKYQDSHIMYNPTIFNSQPNARIKFYENNQRKKRDASPEPDIAPEAREGRVAGGPEAGPVPRESRGWCEDSFGVFCMLFNAVKGDNSEAEATDRLGQGDGDVDTGNLNSLDQPMTPCPSAVEYVTPVFAKNYQVAVLIYNAAIFNNWHNCRACGATWSRSHTRATSPRQWRWSSVCPTSVSSSRARAWPRPDG